jgi:hypothetical protein
LNPPLTGEMEWRSKIITLVKRLEYTREEIRCQGEEKEGVESK